MDPVNDRKNTILYFSELNTRLGSQLGDLGGGPFLGYQRSVSLAPKHRLELGGGVSYRFTPWYPLPDRRYLHPAEWREQLYAADPRPELFSERGAHVLLDYRYSWKRPFDFGAMLDLACLWARGINTYPETSDTDAVRGAVQFGLTARAFLVPYLAASLAAGLRLDSAMIGRGEDSIAGLFARMGINVVF